MRALRSPSTEIAGLRGAFVAWLDEQGLPVDVDVDAMWADVCGAVDLAVSRAGLVDLHAWTVEQVHAVHGAAGAEDGGLVAALPLLLGFLGATGRWHGDPADWEAAVTAADQVTDPLAAVLEQLAEVEVDDAEEDATLRALPVVAQAEALLRFLLPRRAVTATGALRRADIPTAARLVGVDLGDRRPPSMWDVARLPDVWTGLADVGLIAVGSTAAVPSPTAEAWVGGDEAAGRVARRMVLGGYLTAVLTEAPAVPFLPDPLEVLLPALAAAALGRPVPTARLLGEVDGGGPDDGRRSALLGLVTLNARGLLESLAAEEIVVIGDTVDVVPGLRRVVARTTAALLGAVDVGVEPDPGDRPAAPEGAAWRLRIALADASPPVWREVLVDPATPLDLLHEVIQRLFGWQDGHLHQFTASAPGGRRATRYAPPDADDDGWGLPGGRARREAGVRLDQALRPRGTLRYRYDFGDCWDHDITLVGTEPAGGPLPRCVAGSGAGPQEDSGGVRGWAETVAAANDPRHPEHEELRDWLGLAPGQQVDPLAFDLGNADDALADLR